jgi:NAD-dependent SIR2 family protein deacetylase
LSSFIGRHPRLLVLTGAGCSVASGIPEYRDHDGAWKSRPPVRYAEFVASAAVRRRYWARSVFGWERVAGAQPGSVHRALARLEQAGHARAVVTQNVDALHQRAGSRRVIDLHGRLDEVECLGCGARIHRADVQALLLAWNGLFLAALGDVPGASAAARPDGDVQLEADFSDFRVPDCPSCGGVLKPAVVFFGENVPARARGRDAVRSRRCGRAARRGLVADGLLRLPLLPGRPRDGQARRRGQPGPDAGGRVALAEGRLRLRSALEQVVDALGL